MRRVEGVEMVEGVRSGEQGAGDRLVLDRDMVEMVPISNFLGSAWWGTV